jgi:autotransporter-associated beta strand protein
MRTSRLFLLTIFCFGSLVFFYATPARCVDLGPVMPVALDQPHINLLLKTTANGAPLQDSYGFGMFSIDAYLDTGASGVMLSQQTTDFLSLTSKLARYPAGSGPLVVYEDIGVGGTQDFYVTNPIYLGLAKFHPDVDGTSTAPFNQTIGPVQLQITPEDNLDVGAIDVVGMPAMIGKVVVMDPKPVDSFMDSMRTYLYNPGTPYNASAADSEPGIPTTNHHVKLSYASFDRFTTVTPAGATGPTVAPSPFLGPNPVTGESADTPGVTIEFGGAKATGSFLLDTGASTTMISTTLAAQIKIRYRPGTQGTSSPILEHYDSATSQWTAVEDQFTLPIGGVGGTINAAGFFLDDMLVRTLEGNAANDADPNHLKFQGTPVLVNDISLRDPLTNQTLTLDGIFGMNNLVANAMVVPGNPIPSIYGMTSSNFNWIVFDQPNGILGLDVKPPISGWTGGASSDLYVFLYGSADINWSNSSNWDGVSPRDNISLVFGKATPETVNNFNDFPAGTPFKGIAFNGTASFVLQGNRISLTGDVTNDSTRTQTIQLDMELSGAARTFSANTADIVVNGHVSGNQDLIKTGLGKLVLKNTNTLTGDVVVREGSLTLDGGDLAGNTSVRLSSGAFLEVVAGSPAFRSVEGGGIVSVSGSGTTLTVSSITADTLVIGSAISTASWSGGGNPTSSFWTNPANWNGTTPHAFDVLSFGKTVPSSVENFNNFPTGTQFSGIVFSGNSAFNLRGNRLAIAGSVVNQSLQTQTVALDMTLAATACIFDTKTADLVVNGHLSGSGGLDKTGDGTLTLTSTCTYSGMTTIDQGILLLDGGDLADSSPIRIATGAILEIRSGSPTLGSISGQGSLIVVGIGTQLTVPSINVDTLTIGGAGFGAASVPEPSSWMLLALFILCIWKLVACIPASEPNKPTTAEKSAV